MDNLAINRLVAARCEAWKSAGAGVPEKATAMDRACLGQLLRRIPTPGELASFDQAWTAWVKAHGRCLPQEVLLSRSPIPGHLRIFA